MKQILCIFLSLLLVCAPAYSAPATHGAAHPPSLHGRATQKTITTRGNATAKPVQTKATGVAETVPKPPALMGQLIFDELEPPAPQAPTGAKEIYSVPSTTVMEQAPEPETTTIKQETSRFSGSRLRALLKSLSLDCTSCRSGSTDQSWVSELSKDQSLDLAHSIAAYLVHQAPAESTIVRLAPLRKSQRKNLFTPALEESLRKLGFGLVETKEQAPNAKVLRYQVSVIDGGVVIQFRFNQTETSRFYSLDLSSGLVALEPFCVREVR